MSNNMERVNLLNDYLTQYTPENRMGFMRLVLNKYRFENYKLSDNNIQFEDMIVQDNNVRNTVENILNSGQCTEDDFANVFNMLELDQIYYIGF